MKRLLENFKRMASRHFKRNGHSDAVDMNQAFAMSKRPDEDTWKPEKLSDEQKQMVLEHHWYVVYPSLPPTKEKEKLLRLVPSGLTEEEEALFYHGGRAAAAHRYLELFNQAKSKTKLRENLATEGLSNAVEFFDKKLRDSLLEAIRIYRSE